MTQVKSDSQPHFRILRRKRRTLMLTQTALTSFDHSVWQKAETLYASGYKVTLICPMGHEADKRHEIKDGIVLYRYPSGGFIASLFWQFALSIRVKMREDFDVIHACNPPDSLFLVGGFFKFFCGSPVHIRPSPGHARII